MSMRFALFYEIPVPEGASEHEAYKNVLEQAVAGDRYGWDAVWTVEHHFLTEFSHCSNPEILYGAIAARTKNIRIGYGVRLMPKPFNHPVRTAESVGVLDLLSDGRVDFATGRSSTRAELEGFGIDPAETRSMWQEAIGHVVNIWTHDEVELHGKYWSMPKRRVVPKPLQKPHPPIWGATSSDDGHAQVGALGIGLCSFAVSVPPEEVKRKVGIYRDAIRSCATPIGAFVHDNAATFTMNLCAPDRLQALELAKESFEHYPKSGARQIATLTDWMASQHQDLGSYAYAADMKKVDEEGLLDLLTIDYIAENDAAVVGTPEDCIRTCRRYEEAGIDLLLCLVNPFKIPHETVMQTIELMGKHVIPEFKK
ncbi:MAG: LLM class flavin-dependent oxidoreductase [Acidimicrobiales bacterium]